MDVPSHSTAGDRGRVEVRPAQVRPTIDRGPVVLLGAAVAVFAVLVVLPSLHLAGDVGPGGR